MLGWSIRSYRLAASCAFDSLLTVEPRTCVTAETDIGECLLSDDDVPVQEDLYTESGVVLVGWVDGLVGGLAGVTFLCGPRGSKPST